MINNSQEDIFATQEPKKKVKYEYIVLCDKDESSKTPFSLFPITMFTKHEIQEKWLDSILDDSSRLKRLTTLERMPDKIFSLFGKIDEGLSKDQSETVIKSLNEHFLALRESGENITNSLISMTKKFPYRLTSNKVRKFNHFIQCLILMSVKKLTLIK